VTSNHCCQDLCELELQYAEDWLNPMPITAKVEVEEKSAIPLYIFVLWYVS
jgi:hypothetical protein